MFNSKHIELKIGKMRKAQNFILYPYNENDEYIKIQSDKSIGILHKETRKFIFTNKGSYFPHLQLHGAETELAEEIKDEIFKLYKQSKGFSKNGQINIFG